MPEIPPDITALGPEFIRIWETLSEFPSRAELSRQTRVYAPRTLANLDSRGQGPAGRVRVGGKVCYPRTQAVLWLAARTKPV